MRTCLLCGKPADSREHYIPQWLSQTTGRGGDPIVFGTVAAGEILSQSDRGTSLGAKHRNLCSKCNSALGTRLESPVKALLDPLVVAEVTPEITAYFNALLPRELKLLAWWAILRALQLNEQLPESRIPDDIKSSLLAEIAHVRDGSVPDVPKDIHVQAARAVDSVWGFSISAQLFDRSRGTVVHRPGSFLWAMQANRFLMVAVRAPDAHLLKDQGWGYGIVPYDPRPMTPYQDMRRLIEISHIDTRLPKIYSVVKSR